MMLEATVKMSNKEKFLSHYGMIDFSHDKEPFVEKRRAAEESLKELEFPTSKTEYWKYTRINKLIRESYQLGPSELDSDLDLSLPTKNCLVFVNGYFADELSWTEAEDGIEFSALSEAKVNSSLLKEKFDSLTKKEEIFSTINTAYHQDGAFLHLKKGKAAESVYHILNISAGEQPMSNPRNFFYLEAGASAKVVMKHISANQGHSLTNQLSEIFVEKDANLEINKLQTENDKAYQVSNDEVAQADNSQFKMNTISLGGSLLRNNLNLDLNGSHTESWMNGLTLLHGSQHIDHHTLIHHREPNCVSHELYKTVADDSSTGVFNGKVFVHPIAQKTNAYQSNANMVLTDEAKINSKPELEIYADDVQCSHGSTTGQMDEEAMFYLRSRGIGKKKARAVLLNAFLTDLVEHIGVEHIKEEVQAIIDKKYSGVS